MEIFFEIYFKCSFVFKENSIGGKYFLILGCDRLYYIVYYIFDWNKN